MNGGTGVKSATVTVPGRLSAQALALAVLQNPVPGVWVTAAVPDTKTGLYARPAARPQ